MSSGYARLPVTGLTTLTAGEIPAGIPATSIGDGSVSSTKFQYLSTVSSDIQTQLNAKQASSGQGLAPADSPSFGGLTVTGGSALFPGLTTAAVGTSLVIGVDGALHPLLSTADVKENIRPLAVDSTILYRLQSYSYNYIGQDPDEDVSHGFLVEDLAALAPDMVIYKNDKPYSIQHAEFTPLIVEELKKHQQNITHLADFAISSADALMKLDERASILSHSTFWQRLKWLFTGRLE